MKKALKNDCSWVACRAPPCYTCFLYGAFHVWHTTKEQRGWMMCGSGWTPTCTTAGGRVQHAPQMSQTHLTRWTICKARARRMRDLSSATFWRVIMLLLTRGLQLLALQVLLALLMLLGSSSAVQNDATESGSFQPDPQSQDQAEDEDTNQARNGGRVPAEAVRNGESKWRVWL